MSCDIGAKALFYLLALLLPVSALVVRRAPLTRVLGHLAIWAAIFGVGLVALRERRRFDPYVQRVAAWLKLDSQRVVGKKVVGKQARIRMVIPTCSA